MVFGIDFFDTMTNGSTAVGLRKFLKDLNNAIPARVAQPEASTGMFNGGIVMSNPLFSNPMGSPIAMTLRPQFYYGPNARPNAPAFSKGGVVKGKKAKAKKTKK
jgi:hypothetical protein